MGRDEDITKEIGRRLLRLVRKIPRNPNDPWIVVEALQILHRLEDVRRRRLKGINKTRAKLRAVGKLGRAQATV